MKKIQKNKYRIINNLSRYTFIFLLAFTIATPAFAVPCTNLDPDIPDGCDRTEQNTNNQPTKPNTTTNTTPGIKNPINSSGVNIETGIKNPIAGVNDIPSFIETILNFVLVIGIPIVTLAIIYSGFLFVTAAGNSEKLGKAKKALMYTLIGAALLLGSYVIANAIKGTVDEIKSTT